MGIFNKELTTARADPGVKIICLNIVCKKLKTNVNSH